MLRTYLLPRTAELPYHEGYGGCKSWISLDEAVSTEEAFLALDDREFGRIISPVVEALQEQEAAPVGPRVAS